eukprot:6348733-Amphidinium_carterae.1
MGCYLAGSGEAVEFAVIRVMRLGGLFLRMRLLESVPHDAVVYSFAEEAVGAMPAPSDVYGTMTWPAEFRIGASVYLAVPAETGGDPDQVAQLRVSVAAAGETFDEGYQSAAEEPIADARQVVYGGVVRRAAAKPAIRGSAFATSKAGVGGFQRGGAAREGALAAMGKSGLASARRHGAAPKRQTIADLAVTMTNALETLTERIGALEADRRPLVQEQPQEPRASFPQAQTGMAGLKAPGFLYQSSGGAAAASLLAPGRISAKPQGPPPPIAPPGERAYMASLQEARNLLPSPPDGMPVPVGGSREEIPGPGRAQLSNAALRMAVERDGDSANMALQLAMLETLERLGSAGGRRGADHPVTLEEMLAGGSDEGGTSSELPNKLSGVRGILGMQQLCRSIDAEPEKWSVLFDQSVYKALSCDLTGAPWSCHSLTGVPDPEPTSAVHAGLATPMEIATAMAFLRDAKLLDEASKKASGADSGVWGGQQSSVGSGGTASGEQNGGRKKPKGGGRGAGKDGATPPAPKGNAPLGEVLQKNKASIAELEWGILRYLSTRVVPKNRKRGNIAIGGDDKPTYARSMLLGLYTVRGMGISRLTRSHPALLQLCHRIASARSPMSCFRYAAIMVNGNEVVPLHADLHNEGCNCLRAIGEFDGGVFWQPQLEHAPAELPPHGIVDDHVMKGHRISLTFFLPHRLSEVPSAIWSELRSLGFPLDLPVCEVSLLRESMPLFCPDGVVADPAIEKADWAKQVDQHACHDGVVLDLPVCGDSASRDAAGTENEKRKVGRAGKNREQTKAGRKASSFSGAKQASFTGAAFCQPEGGTACSPKDAERNFPEKDIMRLLRGHVPSDFV